MNTPKDSTAERTPGSLHPACSAPACEQEKARLRDEIAALHDAIESLKDFVEGKRHDSENIAEILNGSMRMAQNTPVSDTNDL